MITAYPNSLSSGSDRLPYPKNKITSWSLTPEPPRNIAYTACSGPAAISGFKMRRLCQLDWSRSSSSLPHPSADRDKGTRQM